MTTTTTIEEGDKVVLKSFPDSEEMTVEKISSNEVTCLWVQNNYPRKETFQKSSLQKYDKKNFWKNDFFPKTAGEVIIFIIILAYVFFLSIYAIISISSLCNAKDIFQFIISSITPFGVIISLYAIMKK